MVKNVNHCLTKFKLHPKMSCLVQTNSPQPKDILFTVTEDSIKQKIFSLKTAEPETFGVFMSKMYLIYHHFTYQGPNMLQELKC